MRFLADESCDFAVVQTLRAAGHDVLAVAEIAPRSDDQEVIALAARDERILLTEDKDFGQLVYADMRRTGGVVFIRFPAHARTALPKAVLAMINEKGTQLARSFVVLRPGRVRIGGSPGKPAEG